MNDAVVVGIDRGTSTSYGAQVIMDSGRPRVTRLFKGDVDREFSDSSQGSQRVVFAVPDDQVVVKTLSLAPANSEDVQLRGRFELAQSMPEPETEFEFDLLESHACGYQLGLVYRRRYLESSFNDCACDRFHEAKFLIRSAALGRGYLQFARPMPGELVALADFSDDIISVCFLYQRRIAGLAHLKPDGTDFFSETALDNLAVEFKTVVNFKLADLAKQGISLPLSALIINGTPVNQNLKDVFARYFQGGVLSPEINRGYFADSLLAEEIPFPSFLVALGLTVN